MKRKLFFGERMLYGDGRTPFNLVMPVKIKGQIQPEALAQALVGLQLKHPWLHAGIHRDDEGELWLQTHPVERFPIGIRIAERHDDEQWKSESQKEWAKPFDATKAPLIRVVLLHSQSVCEIMLVIHHCLCDGTATLSIIKELLQLLDQPQSSIGTEIPILKLEDIIPSKVLSSYRRKIKNRLIGNMATLALWLIPIKKVPVNREHDYFFHWKLDPETTSALIQFCKSHGFTVNTLLSAAILKAFKLVRSEKAFNKISLPVDIRNYNKVIKPDHIFAFGLMIVLSAFPNLSFIENVKAIQKDATHKLSKLNPYNFMLMMEACHPAMQNFTNLLKYGKSSNDCMFSNLGRLDIPHQYQNFEVETIYSPTVMGPLGNTTTLIVSTYRNQMDFSFIASEGYLPYAEASAIREKVMEILLSQIEIQTAIPA